MTIIESILITMSRSGKILKREREREIAECSTFKLDLALSKQQYLAHLGICAKLEEYTQSQVINCTLFTLHLQYPTLHPIQSPLQTLLFKEIAEVKINGVIGMRCSRSLGDFGTCLPNN